MVMRPYVLKVFQILRFPYFPQSCYFQCIFQSWDFEMSGFQSVWTSRCLILAFFYRFSSGWVDLLGSPPRKILVRPYVLEVFQILRFPYFPNVCIFSEFCGFWSLGCLNFSRFSPSFQWLGWFARITTCKILIRFYGLEVFQILYVCSFPNVVISITFPRFGIFRCLVFYGFSNNWADWLRPPPWKIPIRLYLLTVCQM